MVEVADVVVVAEDVVVVAEDVVAQASAQLASLQSPKVVGVLCLLF